MDKKFVARELVKLAKELIEDKKSKVAGTWALPVTKGDIDKIVETVFEMSQGTADNLPKESVTDYFYNILGDDELFDDIQDLHRRYLKDCAAVIKKRIKQLASQKEGDFKDKKSYDAIQKINEELN